MGRSSTSGRGQRVGRNDRRRHWRTNTSRCVAPLSFSYKTLIYFPLLQLLKTKKPTGDAERPPAVKRALEIGNLILEHAGARNLSDDSEFDEEETFSSSSNNNDEDDDTNKRPKARTAVARRAPSPLLPARKPRASTTNLMQTIASAFDPDKQQRRDEARAQRNFESTQLLTLTQQVQTL